MHVPNEIRPIVRRVNMPQLDVTQYPSLMAALGDEWPDTTWQAGWIDPHSLFFHQDVDPARARDMPAENRSKPVLITRDAAILDGNHRAWLKWQQHELVQFLRVNVLFADILPWLRTWANTDKATRSGYDVAR